MDEEDANRQGMKKGIVLAHLLEDALRQITPSGFPLMMIASNAQRRIVIQQNDLSAAADA